MDCRLIIIKWIGTIRAIANSKLLDHHTKEIIRNGVLLVNNRFCL